MLLFSFCKICNLACLVDLLTLRHGSDTSAGLFDVYWFGWLLFAIPVLAILLVSVICFCCVSRKNKQGNRNSNLQTVVTLPSLKREASNPQSQPLVNDMESAASTPEEQRKRKKLENDLRSSQLFNVS